MTDAGKGRGEGNAHSIRLHCTCCPWNGPDTALSHAYFRSPSVVMQNVCQFELHSDVLVCCHNFNSKLWRDYKCRQQSCTVYFHCLLSDTRENIYEQKRSSLFASILSLASSEIFSAVCRGVLAGNLV